MHYDTGTDAIYFRRTIKDAQIAALEEIDDPQRAPHGFDIYAGVHEDALARCGIAN